MQVLLQTEPGILLVFKKIRIPDTEAVQAPQLSGVILLAGVVGIQKL